MGTVLKRITRLVGQPVLALDGRIGRLCDLLFDDHSGQALYVQLSDARPERRLVPVACLVPATYGGQGLQLQLTLTQADEFSRTLEPAVVTLRARSAMHLVGRRVPQGSPDAAIVVDVLIDVRDWTVDYVLTKNGPLALSASLAASLAAADAH